MQRYLSKILPRILISSTVLSYSLSAFAQTPGYRQSGSQFINFANNLLSTANILVTLLFVVALLTFAYGIIRFLTAAGDQSEVRNARGYILWGVIGMAVLASLFGLILFLRTMFGVSNQQGSIQAPGVGGSAIRQGSLNGGGGTTGATTGATTGGGLGIPGTPPPPSSIRFKENVETLAQGFALDELGKLQIVSFDYTQGAYSPEDSKHSYGMIAEDVEKIDPVLVDYGADHKPASLKFEKFIGLLVQAVQEIQATIKNLMHHDSKQDTKIKTLEERIDAQQKEINALKAVLEK